MGGYGSGRDWDWIGTRRLVESCIWLDAGRVFTKEARLFLMRDGRVEMNGTKGTESFRVVLRMTDFDGIVLEVRQFFPQRFDVVKVRLTYGYRYYFRCPCGRRCSKVYLPKDENYYRCRLCYRLTYASSNATRPQLWRVLVRLYRTRALR